jgi:hypothetical protein
MFRDANSEGRRPETKDEPTAAAVGLPSRKWQAPEARHPDQVHDPPHVLGMECPSNKGSSMPTGVPRRWRSVPRRTFTHSSAVG